MIQLEPKDEFKSLDEETIRAALAGLKDNPIASEFSRLLEGYIANFIAAVGRFGHVPTDVLLLRL